jgi:hypothetical protein
MLERRAELTSPTNHYERQGGREVSELDEIQICLGCKKRINLLEIDKEKAGYRCLDCQFYFCRKCAEYHFGKTDTRPEDQCKQSP